MAEMSETQRGSGKAHSETRIIDNNLQFDSSDDEAPEEVNFEDSKRSALQSVKDALEASRREKETLKEKRRKKQELFLEQKKRKLLPESLLEEIDARPKIHDESTGKTVEKTQALDSDGTKRTQKRARSLQANCSVTRVKDQLLSGSQQKEAMDFIQSRFYGKNARRTSNSDMLSLERKKGRIKGAAFQFGNKKQSLSALFL
ncbi:nucleolar protein 7 isoform X2 [Engraulis encrasicolus]|uniref:nucleolar protein 7 isoform X2 n=1 Tax=Engraulis encrasicolus TaxID=184585 RepID=UPI002FD553A4